MKAAAAWGAAAVALGLASPAWGFWEVEGEEGSLSVRGFLRFTNTYTMNPGPRWLYAEEEGAQTLAIGRLLGEARLWEGLRVDWNAYQVLGSTTAGGVAGRESEANRSDALEWRWNADPEAEARLSLDRLSVAWEGERARVTVGRQPVSLATTYYFTPNDFFGPFAAQTFFRAYRAGVDAGRVEASVGELGEVSVVGVLGYAAREGALDRPSLRESAVVGRGAGTVGESWEVGLLGGRARGEEVVGVDAQGELWGLLGVRAEGHARVSGEAALAERLELSVGAERRLEGGLHLRAEGFYHGAGASDTASYLALALDPARAAGPYLGRWYGALGAGYELTALLYADSVLLLNLGDRSGLGSVYLLYSVSDEAELALVGSVPFGAEAAGLAAESEFGLYPAALSMDFRLTF